MLHSYWSSSSSLPYIIKLSQTAWELWHAQDFGFRGDNYITNKLRVVLLHATRLLVLLFIPTKYYLNMSKGISYGMHKYVSMDFCFRGANYILKTELSFSHQHAYWSSSSFPPNIINISNSMSLHKILASEEITT